MSRIGRAPISIPSSAKLTVADGVISVQGPKGNLSTPLLGGITVRQEGDQVLVERSSDERTQRSLHGLSRTLVNNMIR